MRYQVCCFLAFCAFSLAIHREEMEEATHNQAACRTLIGLSVAELSEIDVRRI